MKFDVKCECGQMFAEYICKKCGKYFCDGCSIGVGEGYSKKRRCCPYCSEIEYLQVVENE